MTDHESHERSSLLHPGVSLQSGRHSRLSRKSLAFFLLLAVGVACLALTLRRLYGCSIRPSKIPSVPLLLSDEFDAIVVGGGPAGSVLAKLLSDDTWRRVLLIEAGNASQTQLGGKDAIQSRHNTKGLTPFDVPYYWSSVASTPSLHWAYPDVNVAKALGGCGIHNAMLYLRALASDFERWQMEEWTWEMALKHYMAMEDFEGPNSSYHSTHGPLHVTSPTFKTNLSHEFLDACVQLGLPRTNDFNAPGGRYGAGYYHFNARDGVRESAAASYLGPLLDPQTGTSTRRNFHLMLDTIVTRIHINDENVTTGVEIRQGNGTVQHVRLRKQGQVIVTAGAINTPKLLMLSGLGDRPVLEKLGVPVKKHLARVGWNLQDHPVVGMTFKSELPRSIDLNAELTSYFRATSAPSTQNASSYGLFGSAGLSAGAFLIPPGATVPEIQLTLFPRKSEPHMFDSDTLYAATEVVITIALLHPHARSRVELVHDRTRVHDWIPRVVSERPQAAPEHVRAGDVWKISWAIGVVREIAAKLAAKNLLGPEITPGRDIASRKDLDMWVFQSVFRNSHWVGSASMGKTERDGVVDPHLRVFGITNLRVADASVIPLIPNGNVHTTVVMVATRAAQLVRQEEAADRRQRSS